MSNLPTKKQLRAYYLVEVMGESHAEAARLMGISRTAVTNLLTRFYDKKKYAKLPFKKQLWAYYLVEIEGKTQGEAAEIMGVVRSAVTQLLTRFYKGVRENKGPPAETTRLPGDFDDHIRDIF